MNENSEEKEENLPEHSQSNSLKELDEVLTFDIYLYICLGYLRHLGTIHEISGDIKQENCVAGLTVSMCNRPPCSREHPRHGPFWPLYRGMSQLHSRYFESGPEGPELEG